LIEKVTEIQLEETVWTVADFLLEDTVEFSVLGPAPVFLEDLGEARPLNDLEPRQ
jgi:hypothetical protein